MNTLNNIFGNVDQSLERVVILPVGKYTSGTYTIPNGFIWTDFESIEVSGKQAGTQFVNTVIATKEHISQYPTSFKATIQMDNSHACGITAKSLNTYEISRSGISVGVAQIIGYKKKYTSENSSKIIAVNDGKDIVKDKRYEIDIATELGTDYLGRDLIVVAEIYNDGSVTNGGKAGWGESGKMDASGTSSRFVIASAFGDKIIVQTGTHGLTWPSRISGSPFGRTLNTEVTKAKARVKVWKVDQFLPKDTDAGGSKNAPYIVERGGNAATGYYQKWSDGLIEQWGSVVKSRTYINTEEIKVPLPIKFTKLDSMAIQVTWYGRVSAGSSNMSAKKPESTAEIVILPDGSHSGSLPLDGYSWLVKGY